LFLKLAMAICSFTQHAEIASAAGHLRGIVEGVPFFARLELKKAGFNIRQGINAKAFGINLVTRWLRSGRLRSSGMT